MIAVPRADSRLGKGVIFAIPFVAAVALTTIQPSDGAPTICGFANCTGVACPGCGMTRAAGYLLRGHVGEALRYHPLVPLILLEFLGAWTIWAAHQAGWIRWRHHRWVDVVIGGTAALLVIVWIVRLVTGTRDGEQLTSFRPGSLHRAIERAPLPCSPQIPASMSGRVIPADCAAPLSGSACLHHDGKATVCDDR